LLSASMFRPRRNAESKIGVGVPQPAARGTAAPRYVRKRWLVRHFRALPAGRNPPNL
jgi:hypothetical protein